MTSVKLTDSAGIRNRFADSIFCVNNRYVSSKWYEVKHFLSIINNKNYNQILKYERLNETLF